MEAPSEEALREMMASAAAAASAATAAVPIPEKATSIPEPPRYARYTPTRPPASRRQSISMLPPFLGGENNIRIGALPNVQNGERMKRINAVAREIASKWTHPPGSTQYETDNLHQVRAILYMNKSLITQSFVSHVSGVSQGSLSHYVRGLFRGNQKNVEERLSAFVRKFADGTLDSLLEAARIGTRTTGRPSVYEQIISTALEPLGKATPTTAGAIPDSSALSKPPIPPPPPPQLQPAPWARAAPPMIKVNIPTTPIEKPPPAPPVIEEEVGEDEIEIEIEEPSTQAGATNRVSDRARRLRHRRAVQAHKQTLSKRPRPIFPSIPEETQQLTPVLAVEKAYHALVAPKWTNDWLEAEPLLIPIELFVEKDGKTLHMYTQWDVNERHLSPELVSERICKARKLPVEFAASTAMQIRRALFEAGVICPPPPDKKEENRRLVKIVVNLKLENSMHILRDDFEWDLGAGCLNSPELFAQHLCSDAKVSQKHANDVAKAIRKQLSIAQAISYGDEETKKLALDLIDENSALKEALPPITTPVGKNTSADWDARVRDENKLSMLNSIINPILDSVQVQTEKRTEDRARMEAAEKARQELEEIRRAEMKKTEEEDARIRAIEEKEEKKAEKVLKERNLDFRPYLGLRIARGEKPSLWMPAAFDRRRRKQLTFPMTQPTRRGSTNNNPSAPVRPLKRRRSSKREDNEKDNEMQSGSKRSRRSDAQGSELKKIYLRLRIRQ